jgi:hypothetical protein
VSDDPRAVVLVEGASDRVALETLARRQGLDLVADGVEIVAIGGAQAISRAVGRYGADVRLAGLCDAGEERHFRRALAGGVFVCDRDLEDELLRALGPRDVLEVFAVEGELAAFNTYRKQPAHRDRPFEEQLHGFLWNRKQLFARAFVEALELGRVPPPLDGVLAYVVA